MQVVPGVAKMPTVDPHRTFTQAPNLFSKFASPHCPPDLSLLVN